MSYFSHCCDKIPDTQKLKGEKFVQAHSFSHSCWLQGKQLSREVWQRRNLWHSGGKQTEEERKRQTLSGHASSDPCSVTRLDLPISYVAINLRVGKSTYVYHIPTIQLPTSA